MFDDVKSCAADERCSLHAHARESVQTLRLAAVTRLHALSFDHLAGLAACAEELRIAAGGRLLLDGRLHHELALIVEGRGTVRCAGETVGALGPGDVFGALSTRRAAYATATVRVIENMHLVAFRSHSLRALRASDPEAVAALLAACALDLRERATASAGSRPAPELTLVGASAA
jgi:CRP-like cAMP-binding protein